MFRLKGYDSLEFTETIELPDMAELIKYPFYDKADIEFCYKHSNSDIKYLLDKIPLKNNRKYTTVRLFVQIIGPHLISVPRAAWHYDNNGIEEENTECITHLLLSDCTALTEFSQNEIVLPQFNIDSDPLEIERYMNKNSYIFNPAKVSPNKFTTFRGFTPHRCTRPQKREFRFMFRVIESNFILPNEENNNIRNISSVYIDDHDLSDIQIDYLNGKEVKRVKSIEKDGNKIIIWN